MKKIVYFFLVALIFVSCKKSKQEIMETNEPSTSVSIEKIAEEEEENNITGDNNYDIYKDIQTLNFEWSGYNIKIMKAPLEEEILYTIQKGDKINISPLQI